ncbi:hypothetical protein EJ04DRAFT_232587 [Polyplosphaeria fusca]|uniref:Uncharacterized protein n=1 Tax=Polyplosphaeria fusca TaxID=682080 RepID=A0A9P4V882_9PLEO|nr:hypothetical protein EJ04DRAFT_232587 [Polyplosphaeria fusca]
MHLAPIETLPPELLHPIFTLSGLNLSLPKSSPILAHKLSSVHIYNTVCTHYLTQSLDDIPRAHITAAQTVIFASKWMTWDFFKQWIMQKFGDREDEKKGCLCGKTVETGCFDAQWPPNFNDATTMLYTRSHLPAFAWTKGRVPVKLLHDWDTGKLQFLRFLLWTTGMTVDWANPEVRRVALEGKKEAILAGNLEVVELYNHNRRLGKAPGMDMVRFAVMEGGCNRSIVFDTMATARDWGIREEAWNDDALDNWCEERIQKGDPKGPWLKKKLAELRMPLDEPPINVDGKKVRVGEMHPKTGDYEAEGDMLVVHTHRWNQVSRVPFRRCGRTRGW